MGGGYKVTVYRGTKDGAGYRKIQEYGKENGIRAGILWKKTRVYAVVWVKEGEVRGSAAGEGSDEDKSRRAPARGSVGSERGHNVTSSNSRPSTCVAGSVGSTEANDVEQQRKAAWAWKRPENAFEGVRERTAVGVLVEHMDGKDVDSLWAVLCALDGRLSSKGGVEKEKARSGNKGGE